MPSKHSTYPHWTLTIGVSAIVAAAAAWQLTSAILPAQVTPAICNQVCATVPPDQMQLCLSACLAAAQNSGGQHPAAGGGQSVSSIPASAPSAPSTPSNSGFPSLPPLPPLPPLFNNPPGGGASSAGALPAAPASSAQPALPFGPGLTSPPAQPVAGCPATGFRQQQTNFCIVAGLCAEAALLRRNFIHDDGCRDGLVLTHIYGDKKSLPASVPTPQPTVSAPLSLRDITALALEILRELIPQIPASFPVRHSAQELQNYLEILAMNLDTRDLTPVEAEATTQYLQQRIAELAQQVKSSGAFATQQVALDQKRQEVLNGLGIVVFDLFPRLFDTLSQQPIAKLDLVAARGIHAKAAQKLNEAKGACAVQSGSACTTVVGTVFEPLHDLQTMLEPRLEEAGQLVTVEEKLRIDTVHGTAPSQGFPLPFIQGNGR